MSREYVSAINIGDYVTDKYLKFQIISKPTETVYSQGRNAFLRFYAYTSQEPSQLVEIFVLGGLIERFKPLQPNTEISIRGFRVNAPDCHALFGSVPSTFRIFIKENKHIDIDVLYLPPNESVTSLPPSFTSDGPTNRKYTPLCAIRAGGVYNVIALVRYFRPPKKSLRGPDYFCVVTITDPTCFGVSYDKIVCMFFSPEMSKLPAELVLGDIIRIHRLKIVTYGGQLQGQSRSGMSWVVFSMGVNYDIGQSSSDNYFTPEEQDLDYIKMLGQWFVSNPHMDDVETVDKLPVETLGVEAPENIPLMDTLVGENIMADEPDITCTGVAIEIDNLPVDDAEIIITRGGDGMEIDNLPADATETISSGDGMEIEEDLNDSIPEILSFPAEKDKILTFSQINIGQTGSTNCQLVAITTHSPDGSHVILHVRDGTLNYPCKHSRHYNLWPTHMPPPSDDTVEVKVHLSLIPAELEVGDNLFLDQVCLEICDKSSVQFCLKGSLNVISGTGDALF